MKGVRKAKQADRPGQPIIGGYRDGLAGLNVSGKKMKKLEKHSVELRPDEYDTLMRNPMINSVCGDLLASPRKRSGYLVLRLTAGQLEELTGFVASEANHAQTREEEDALGDVCECLEGVLSGIRFRKDR